MIGTEDMLLTELTRELVDRFAPEQIVLCGSGCAAVLPPRTHDLPILRLRLPAKLRDDPILTEACEGLNKLWPGSRYLGSPLPTREQMDEAVAWRGKRGTSCTDSWSGIEP